MGCRLSRTESIDQIEEKTEAPGSPTTPAAAPKPKPAEKRTNGQSVLTRRDTPQTLPLNEQTRRETVERGGNGVQGGALASKPIGEVESASQADFFRMLDEKIAHGRDLDETPSDMD